MCSIVVCSSVWSPLTHLTVIHRHSTWTTVFMPECTYMGSPPRLSFIHPLTPSPTHSCFFARFSHECKEAKRVMLIRKVTVNAVRISSSGSGQSTRESSGEWNNLPKKEQFFCGMHISEKFFSTAKSSNVKTRWTYVFAPCSVSRLRAVFQLLRAVH